MIPTTHVLFLATSSNASPARGGRERIVAIANEVQRYNIKSRILCFVPFEQILLGLKYLKTGKAKLEEDSNCKVYYVLRFPLTRLEIIDWFNMYYCGLVSFLFCYFLGVNIIYGHGSEAGHIGIHAKKVKKSLKVISDFHGASAEEYMYSLRLQTPDKIALRLERHEVLTLKQSDWVVFVSQAMRKYYEKKFGIPIFKSNIIPCATETKFLLNIKKRDVLRQEYGLTNKLVICYVGSAVDYQLVDKMCQLFGKIKESFPFSYFLIISHHVDQFQKHLNTAGIKHEFYEILSVDHQQVYDLLQMGDIGLLLRDNSIVNTVASPTKFAEYGLCGLPIITTDYVGDFSAMAREFNLGYIVDMDNLEIDKNLFAFLADVQNKRIEYAAHCSTYARERLTWDTYGPKLVKIFANFLLP